jgi:hypothetical protein
MLKKHAIPPLARPRSRNARDRIPNAFTEADRAQLERALRGLIDRVGMSPALEDLLAPPAGRRH